MLSERNNVERTNLIRFPLEVHLVHYNEAYGTIGNALGHSDGLAVLGIFFEIGADNKLVEVI